VSGIRCPAIVVASSVLLLKVWVPVNVTTVLSISTVTVWPDTVVSSPVPPAIVSVWESRSIEPVPVSPAISKSSKVICAAT